MRTVAFSSSPCHLYYDLFFFFFYFVIQFLIKVPLVITWKALVSTCFNTVNVLFVLRRDLKYSNTLHRTPPSLPCTLMVTH